MDERSTEERLWTVPWCSGQCLYIPTAVQANWEDTVPQ